MKIPKEKIEIQIKQHKRKGHTRKSQTGKIVQISPTEVSPHSRMITKRAKLPKITKSMIPQIRKKTDKYNLIAFSSDTGEMINKAGERDYQFIVTHFPSMESIHTSGYYIEMRMGDQFMQRWDVPKGVDPAVFLKQNADNMGIAKNLMTLKGRTPKQVQAKPIITPEGVIFRKKKD